MKTRRDFLKNAGGLLVGFSLAESSLSPLTAAPPPTRLDSWLHVGTDGFVTILTGKVDIGMGVQTALMQVVAEELELPPSRIRLVMGDTSQTPDQGGVGGSTTISSGSIPLRNVAATARRMLLDLASQRLALPPERLHIANGSIGDGKTSFAYAALVDGKEFNETLHPAGSGFSATVEGSGRPKNPATYTVVGKPFPRVDLPPKILGQATYSTDVRVEGMLHGRVIRPNAIGASVAKVDDSAARAVPGFVRTVVKGNFVGVVAQTEWAAVKAARAVKVEWSKPSVQLPKDLYGYMRAAAPKATREGAKTGDARRAIEGAAKKMQASYQWPFQSHATMGPGCAVADIRPDGVSTVWCGTQKPHALQRGLADLMKLPLDSVRVIWVQDAGSYGRAGHEDTAADAAVLSQALGKPVRVQWMRHDMTTWGPKGPATVFDLSAGLRADGALEALEYTTRSFSGGEVLYQANSAGNLLAGQLMGIANTTGIDEFVQWGESTPPYKIPNLRSVAHIVPAFIPLGSPLRCTHLRDPNGPSSTFAAESFMDELAAAAGADPLEYRMRHLTDERAKAVLTAVAERVKWEPRAGRSGKPGVGRGVAIALRGGTYVATVADVEVDRATGAVRVKRIVCAHDCGLIVNPSALRGTVAANLVQATGRTLHEEVRFTADAVTSADWLTYPVVRMGDVPELDIILIDRPNRPSTGAGEPSSRPVAAAIANAIFDATGARLRTAPLTPERVKEALA